MIYYGGNYDSMERVCKGLCVNGNVQKRLFFVRHENMVFYIMLLSGNKVISFRFRLERDEAWHSSRIKQFAPDM